MPAWNGEPIATELGAGVFAAVELDDAGEITALFWLHEPRDRSALTDRSGFCMASRRVLIARELPARPGIERVHVLRSADPLTVAPGFECAACGRSGWIRAGAWVEV